MKAWLLSTLKGIAIGLLLLAACSFAAVVLGLFIGTPLLLLASAFKIAWKFLFS